jgi:hypothetical protein
MWSDLVIFPFPIVHDHPAFSQGIEYFSPQTFPPELVMETFDIPVLPWAAWGDIQRFDILLLQPISQCTANKLRPIV